MLQLRSLQQKLLLRCCSTTTFSILVFTDGCSIWPSNTDQAEPQEVMQNIVYNNLLEPTLLFISTHPREIESLATRLLSINGSLITQLSHQVVVHISQQSRAIYFCGCRDHIRGHNLLPQATVQKTRKSRKKEGRPSLSNFSLHFRLKLQGSNNGIPKKSSTFLMEITSFVQKAALEKGPPKLCVAASSDWYSSTSENFSNFALL